MTKLNGLSRKQLKEKNDAIAKKRYKELHNKKYKSDSEISEYYFYKDVRN